MPGFENELFKGKGKKKSMLARGRWLWLRRGCSDEAPSLMKRIERGCAADTEVLCCEKRDKES